MKIKNKKKKSKRLGLDSKMSLYRPMNAEAAEASEDTVNRGGFVCGLSLSLSSNGAATSKQSHRTSGGVMLKRLRVCCAQF
jgi:hypothetical protein